MRTTSREFDWATLAEKLQLGVSERPEPGTGTWGKARLEGTRRGVHVVVEVSQARRATPYQASGTGNSTYAERRLSNVSSWFEGRAEVSVRYALERGPTFRLLRQGTLRTWLKSFGYQDIEIGNHNLDYALTIKGSPPELVKTVFLSDADGLLSFVKQRNGTLPQSDGVELTSSLPLITDERDRDLGYIENLVDLLSKMASADLGGLEALRAIPEASDIARDGVAVGVVVQAPAAVEFLPLWQEGGFQSRARASLARSIVPGTASCADAAAVKELSKMSNVGAKLKSLSEATLIVDAKHASLIWSGIEEDPERLVAAAEFLSRVCAPTGDGAYR